MQVISLGRYEEADPLYLQALEIPKQALGENHPNTNTIRQNLQDFQDAVIRGIGSNRAENPAKNCTN